jgi:hypothetical protein
MARTVLASLLCGNVGTAAADMVSKHEGRPFPSVQAFYETRPMMSSSEELAIAKGLKVEEDS